MKTSIFFGVFLAIPFAFAQNHKGLTFQGFLKNPQGALVTANGVSITSRIVSPNGCVLMVESHGGVNIAEGFFTVVLGKGTRGPGDKGLDLKGVFSNSATRTGYDTAGGATGNCNYSPTSNDARKVSLDFLVGSDTIQADFNIRANAFAVMAESSEDSSKLDGKAATEFLQVNSSANVTQAKLEEFVQAFTSLSGGAVKWNGTNFVAYNPADGAGLSSNSVPGAAVASLPWSKLTSVPSPLTQIGGLSCSNGQMLKVSGGSWTCIAATSGGTVTTLTSANAYITVANASTTPEITLNVGTAANTVAAGDDSRFGNASEITSLATTGIVQRNGAASYSTVTVATPLSYSGGTLGAAVGTSNGTLAAGDDSRFGDASKIHGADIDLTGLASGHVLKYDGTKWAPAASTDSSKVAKTGDTMTGPLTLPVDGLALGTDQLVTSGGKVGIGTSSPNALLHTYASGTNQILVQSGASSFMSFTQDASDGYIAGGANGTLFIRPEGPAGKLVLMAGGLPQATLTSSGFGLNANPVNKLDVAGGAAIGFSYAGVSTAPSNGLLVEGNVGVGTTSPGSNTKLAVAGQVKPGSGSISTGSVDWSVGNTVTTSFDCGSNVSFANLRDGGSYTLVVTGTGTTQCTFGTTTTGDDAATVTYHFKPANAARTATSHSIYSIFRSGSHVYVGWSSGW